jgi:hypothetical protein
MAEIHKQVTKKSTKPEYVDDELTNAIEQPSFQNASQKGEASAKNQD